MKVPVLRHRTDRCPHRRADVSDEEQLADTESEAERDVLVDTAPVPVRKGAASAGQEAAEPAAKRPRPAPKAMSKTRWTGLAKVSLVSLHCIRTVPIETSMEDGVMHMVMTVHSCVSCNLHPVACTRHRT